MSDLSLTHALLLGILEGITEFLPVSSTGHLIVASAWLGARSDTTKTFEIFIQLGAILAVCWHYRNVLTTALLEAHRSPVARRFLATLLVAFAPAALLGVLYHDLIKQYLFSPHVVAISLMVGGVAMLWIERVWGARASRAPLREDRADRLPFKAALGIGIAQMLALIPGVSRSGATIMGGMVLGLPRSSATEFSFFLAVPVMIAATLFDLIKSRHGLTAADAPAFAVGLISAFATALIVIRLFLRFVSRHDFTGFAWYRIAFGSALLVAIARSRVG